MDYLSMSFKCITYENLASAMRKNPPYDEWHTAVMSRMSLLFIQNSSLNIRIIAMDNLERVTISRTIFESCELCCR